MPSAAGLHREMRQKTARHRDTPMDCHSHEKDTAGWGVWSSREDASSVEVCCEFPVQGKRI
jgi:hypothetical protein